VPLSNDFEFRLPGSSAPFGSIAVSCMDLRLVGDEISEGAAIRQTAR
jgi:hypothetical protein